MIGGPEIWYPRVHLADIRGQQEAHLVKQQDKCFCLQSQVLFPAEGHQRYALFRQVAVERDRFVRHAACRRQYGVGVQLDPAGVQQQLLDPGN